MKVTKEEQQALLALADTDEQIRLLEHRRANLEEQRILDSHVEIRERVIDELLDASRIRDNLETQNTRLEREIQTVDAGRKAKENEMFSGRITSEKELEAARSQIRSMQDRKNDLEDSLIETMEQLEEVTDLVEDLTTRRAELADQIADLTLRRDTAATDIDAEMVEILTRREAEVDMIPEEAMGAYEKLRTKRPGRAVARLEGRNCTGCHMELTAIELEEIKETASSSLAYCQQCGSIVVVA